MAFGRMVLLSIIRNVSGVLPGGSVGPALPSTQLNNITELKIKFDITKAWTQSYNQAKITVYNCQYTTSQIWGAVGNHLVFSAGYQDEGGPKSIFLGDINRSTYVRNGTETEWQIEAYDGGGKGTDQYISLSYPAGTTASSILNYLITLSNMPVGYIPAIVKGVYPHGYSGAGRLIDVMLEVALKAGLTFTITNGGLYFFNPQSAPPVNTTQVILMDAKHGMIGFPEPILENYQKNGYDTSPPRKWRTKSIIFAHSAVTGTTGSQGTIFKLSSTIKSGFFVAESLHFTGDNFDEDFVQETDMRALPSSQGT